MLIRLVSHPTDNPLHMDKMIVLNGLPEKMMFDTKNGKRFLKEPWKADVTENIPKPIRQKFGKESIWSHIRSTDKAIPDMEDELEIYAVSIDYQIGPGETLWKQIERMIDMSTPRDERLPVPVMVARSRAESFSLEADDIPVVDFDAKPDEGAKEKKAEMKGPGLRCPVCNKTFDREPQMRMHKARTGHRESQAVTAA